MPRIEAFHAEETINFPQGPATANSAMSALVYPQRDPSHSPRPLFDAITVPLICQPYDGADFFTYPASCGWVIRRRPFQGKRFRPMKTPDDVGEYVAERIDKSPATGSQRTSFLQRWLFFGLLEAVSQKRGVTVDIWKEFVRADSQVTTAPLNDIVSRWYGAGGDAGASSILRMAQMARMVLHKKSAQEEASIGCSNDDYRVLGSLLFVLRAVALFLIRLEKWPPGALLEVVGVPEREVGTMRHGWAGDAGLRNWAEDELSDQGWCCTEYWGLLPGSVLQVAVEMKRPRMRDHSECEGRRCSAGQTDEATYQTRHVADGCKCQFLDVDGDALVRILNAGKIPKIAIVEFKDGVKLSVVEGSPKESYTAISHVWADGLGNPHKNALPSCQIRRLQSRLNGLSKSAGITPGVFWMDTLCIPVHPAARKQRKLAIQRLRDTFSTAAAVLVLDREFETVDSRTITFVEFGIRVLCGGWIKRLWTLEESAFSGPAKLFFQMLDGPFPYPGDEAAVAAEASETRTMTSREVARVFLMDSKVLHKINKNVPPLHTIRGTVSGDLRPNKTLGGVAKAIRTRDTSKREDFPICVGSLLGLDLREILDRDTLDDRMKEMYIQLREITLNMLCLGDFEEENTLAQKPFRWALREIPYIIDPPERSLTPLPPGICDKNGLHVTGIRSFLFDRVPKPAGKNGFVRDQFVRIAGALPGPPLCIPIMLVVRDPDFQLEACKGLAVWLLPGMYRQELLVEVEGILGGEIFCRIIGESLVGETDPDVDLMPEGSEVVYRGSFLDGNQRWCVT